MNRVEEFRQALAPYGDDWDIEHRSGGWYSAFHVKTKRHVYWYPAPQHAYQTIYSWWHQARNFEGDTLEECNAKMVAYALEGR